MKKPCKVLLFYNPLAGNGLFKSNLDMIVDRFQRRNMVVVPVRASRQRQLDVIFQNMDVSEYRKLIAAGGDGTINVMVNAMLRNGIDLPLAIFPSGTANDFAYYMDLPTRMDEMIDIALEERYTLADVGKANSSYFINVLAMGMMVDVSQKIDPGIKNTLGVISYYIRGFSELPNLRPIAVRISGDGFCIEENIFFMLAMNGRSAGGFKRIAPDAEINDGLLDVLVFKAMPIVEMAPLLVNVMTGQHKGNKNVIFFRTSRMRVESEQAINTDVDGEKGGALPLEVSLLPRRIRVNTLKDDMDGTMW